MSLRNEAVLELKPDGQMIEEFRELYFSDILDSELVSDPNHPEQWIVDLEGKRVKLSRREANAFLLGATATLKKWKEDTEDLGRLIY